MISSETLYGILEIIMDLFPFDCIILSRLADEFEMDITTRKLNFSCLTLSASVAYADIAFILAYTKNGDIITFHLITDCDLIDEELATWANRSKEKFPQFKFLCHHFLREGELTSFLHRQENLFEKLKAKFSEISTEELVTKFSPAG
jgi:hypothetical protein